MIPAGFIRVPPDIPCMDRWPAGTLTPQKLQAYRDRQDAGSIAGLTVEQGAGAVTVRYLSDCPHEWMLRILASGIKAAAEQIVIGDLP